METQSNCHVLEMHLVLTNFKDCLLNEKLINPVNTYTRRESGLLSEGFASRIHVFQRLLARWKRKTEVVICVQFASPYSSGWHRHDA